MVVVFDNVVVVYDQDFIGIYYGGQVVGDDQCGLVDGDKFELVLDGVFGG